MSKKILGSYYPNCSSKKPSYSKSEMIDGVIEIKEGNLEFTAKLFQLITLKSNHLSIPLRDIEHVEAMNLNGMMPFGVCIFIKDGKEYMLGAIRNKKLKSFIEEARLIN